MVDALRDAAGDGRFGTQRAVADGRHREVERLEERRNAVELFSNDLSVALTLHSYRRHVEKVVRQRSHVFPVHFPFIGSHSVANGEFLENSLAGLDKDSLQRLGDFLDAALHAADEVKKSLDGGEIVGEEFAEMVGEQRGKLGERRRENRRCRAGDSSRRCPAARRRARRSRTRRRCGLPARRRCPAGVRRERRGYGGKDGGDGVGDEGLRDVKTIDVHAELRLRGRREEVILRGSQRFACRRRPCRRR